ncbi:Crp/Fnr family transcriptional regulator [Pedobacter antarcticus]|uniref:Cyclic nucleotide-binding protein n=2 Tax=Pedobacter antarcticus TaxID=34086 RepID=A0A081PKW4_9SPHI|nr:Crp/Fnr family transcriptional regulator [Pedobacter antarcticus]KEQ31337.1 cyclic nucleotide-binding protein [Pedobacter antarcticus 4BY]SDL47529.1 cAMP-binding domain of CRP or a regulatory subunit of cAMP-dependent protein kinases [Pedobacter antarcticus]SFE37434.1 cAMP-binding domain of CRP or a regulatory subunit of cAMP-dependent protein kinases [Pedobacter antarcticus]
MIIEELSLLSHKNVAYKKGEVIYSPGQQPRFVYFISRGQVRMVTVNGDGKEFIQGIFKKNQYFGEPAMLLSKPYLAYTIATEDTSLILLEREQFLSLLENNREFSVEVITTLSKRLFYKSMMLEELANEHADHRLRTLITYLCKELKPDEVLPVTRQALADMSGLRVETVIRLIKKMSKTGEIKLLRGKIVKQ